MTCRYDITEWLDVLYTSVRNTQGGVADAANHLTVRRGKNISAESLRLRLRGVGDSRLSMEMFELLIEWMQEKSEAQAHALDALHALNARFGLVAERVDDHPVDEGHDPGTMRLVTTTLHLQAHVGKVADDVTRALEDQRIDDREAEQIIATGRKGQRLFQRLIHAARNLAARRRR
ncbi:phage regulatory CII family protein [Burkholderia sp. ABCPW 14]|uniref:phage regulatory CII family protein n=1 Tax=Burkholderia sp. ABCPW 14 TaxID=1637860 RepID=UPI0009EB1DE6|nr:phage regulatory CII family protein [Burkholderia sp. ABCPW 14]